ncbi:hypothetical protein [Paraprevotella xylaniphila]|uniref:hypothetical protein n=1 Tax=Paraprevotella xylaniphila TaxID=454155 RepID=UPI0023F320E0|nr:hypothetical protein [Paraprevotella xylaniphila]
MWEDFYELIAQQDKRDREGLIEMRVLLEKVIEEDMKKEKESACPAYRESEEKECESTVFTNMETEEIEKNKRWRAKMGETYFYVGSDAVVYSTKELYGNRNDRYWDVGNYFRTSEEALRYSSELIIMFQERTLDK